MKIALIYSFKESNWFSCNVILRNTVKLYENIYGSNNLIHVDYDYNSRKSDFEFQKLYSKEVSKIVFLDHLPTPLVFLRYFLQRNYLEDLKQKEFIIHVYGDFPLYSRDWMFVTNFLLDHKVKFICASKRQERLIGNFVNQEEIVFHSPFPVNGEEFYFNEELRDKKRKSLGIKDERVYLYTGRLSQQKNILELIEEFFESLRKQNIPEDSLLIFAGDFDKLGFLYLGLTNLDGEYFRKVDKCLSENDIYRDRVKFLGPIEHNELNELYNAADCFISLSVYHDEDYGMSVAEALCTGLPAILTNWAGFASFQNENNNDFVSLVDVELSQRGPKFLKDDLQKVLKTSFEKNYDRSKYSQVNKDSFSIAGAFKGMKSIQEAEVPFFSGRSDLMSEVINNNMISGNMMFKADTDLCLNKLYFKVYKNYVR